MSKINRDQDHPQEQLITFSQQSKNSLPPDSPNLWNVIWALETWEESHKTDNCKYVNDSWGLAKFKLYTAFNYLSPVRPIWWPVIIVSCMSYILLSSTVPAKNLEEKDGQTQLLYYVSLIRACNKVLYELVYIGKKFVFLKKNLDI